MRRIVVIVLSVAATVVLFCGLHVFGAYHAEHQGALDRAAEMEKEASRLEAEGTRMERQNKCNTQWQEYQTALLKYRNAEMLGRPSRMPLEPSCTGYSPRIDDAINKIFEAAEVKLQAIAAREYVQYERNYAANRKLQTKYLGLRLWAFLTGTNVEKKQAELERDEENKVKFASCLEAAKRSSDLQPLCQKMYGPS